MKANEFRVGNLVLNDGVINVINMIGYDSVSLLTRQGNSITAHLDLIKPIPLTEEILIKAGFEKVPTFTIMNTLILDLGRNKQLSIGNLGTPNEMSYLQEVDYENQKEITDLVCIHNYDYNGKLYLHALQNKIYSLTGTELKIEL